MAAFAVYYRTVSFRISKELIDSFRTSFLERFDEHLAPLRNNTIMTSDHGEHFRVFCQITVERWEEFRIFAKSYSAVVFEQKDSFILSELRITHKRYKYIQGVLTNSIPESFLYYFAKDSTHHRCYCRLPAEHEDKLRAFCQKQRIRAAAPKAA